MRSGPARIRTGDLGEACNALSLCKSLTDRSLTSWTELDDWPELAFAVPVISLGLAMAYYRGAASPRRQLRLVSARFVLLPIRDLKTHEAAEPERVRRVIRQIRSTGQVKKAIAVDARSMVVLDGVHRLSALKALGSSRVPAWLIDYSSEDVMVVSKSRKSQITKEDVVRAATQGPKLPPKSTRHMVKREDGTIVHISKLEGDISVPLSTLLQPL